MNTSSPVIVFRVDASVEIGLGHVMRCMTLARAARTRYGYGVIFCVSGSTLKTVPQLHDVADQVICLDGAALDVPEAQAQAIAGKLPAGRHLLVVDHYGLDVQFEEYCRTFSRGIVVIDDLANREHDCDVLVDQTLGRTPLDYAELLPADCHVMAGPRYGLLRPQFLEHRRESLERRAVRGDIDRVFVSFGGTIGGNIIENVLKILSRVCPSVRVDVVVGASVSDVTKLHHFAAALPIHVEVYQGIENIAELMAQADLAVGAGGGMSWERCALGLPCILFVLADNQIENARRLAEVGAVWNLGEWGDDSLDMLADAMTRLVDEPEILSVMSKKACQVVDGRGCDRVLVALSRIDGQKTPDVSLRLVEREDMHILFDWQCDPLTRMHARNPETPTWEDHVTWFTDRVFQTPGHTVIIERDGEPVGVLRLDPWQNEDSWEVSVVIAPRWRGHGLASQGIRLLLRMVPGLRVVAEVSPQNEASLKLFAGLGFVPTDQANIFVHEKAPL